MDYYKNYVVPAHAAPVMYPYMFKNEVPIDNLNVEHYIDQVIPQQFRLSYKVCFVETKTVEAFKKSFKYNALDGYNMIFVIIKTSSFHDHYSLLLIDVENKSAVHLDNQLHLNYQTANAIAKQYEKCLKFYKKFVPRIEGADMFQGYSTLDTSSVCKCHIHTLTLLDLFVTDRFIRKLPLRADNDRLSNAQVVKQSYIIHRRRISSYILRHPNKPKRPEPVPSLSDFKISNILPEILGRDMLSYLNSHRNIRMAKLENYGYCFPNRPVDKKRRVSKVTGGILKQPCVYQAMSAYSCTKKVDFDESSIKLTEAEMKSFEEIKRAVREVQSALPYVDIKVTPRVEGEEIISTSLKYMFENFAANYKYGPVINVEQIHTHILIKLISY